MAKKKLPKFEFKPDPTGADPLKIFYLTRQQRKRALKWVLYALLVLVTLVIQDTMLSRIRISGATTNLMVCTVLLIGILEGPESGGLFALLCGVFYHFSGSAPGPYVIAVMTAVTIVIGLFRQSYWRQGLSTTVLCTGLAMLVYELALLVIGIFMNLTIWSRLGVFVGTALLSTVMIYPLYPLVRVIGKIGGETWKE